MPMQTLKQEINIVQDMIKQTAELFYRQNEKDGYEAMTKLLDQMDLMMNHLVIAIQTKKADNADPGKLLQILGEAMQAMNKKDSVLLADILQYDLTEQLDAIRLYDEV